MFLCVKKIAPGNKSRLGIFFLGEKLGRKKELKLIDCPKILYYL